MEGMSAVISDARIGSGSISLGALAVQLRRSNQEIDQIIRLAGVTPTQDEFGIYQVTVDDAARIADVERSERAKGLENFRKLRESWTWAE
jgi:hypothetical protein